MCYLTISSVGHCTNARVIRVWYIFRPKPIYEEDMADENRQEGMCYLLHFPVFFFQYHNKERAEIIT